MSNGANDQRDLDQKRYRFDATVNVAHILTTVGMMIALFSWGAEIKTKIGQHDSEITNIKSDRATSSREVRESLRELNAKIDRLIERGAR